jgi:hypothetical protein
MIGLGERAAHHETTRRAPAQTNPSDRSFFTSDLKTRQQARRDQRSSGGGFEKGSAIHKAEPLYGPSAKEMKWTTAKFWLWQPGGQMAPVND